MNILGKIQIKNDLERQHCAISRKPHLMSTMAFIATLEDVQDHYAADGRAAQQGKVPPRSFEKLHSFVLTEIEKRQLIAFLNSLTDTIFI